MCGAVHGRDAGWLRARLVVQLASISVTGPVDSAPSWGRGGVIRAPSAAPGCPLWGWLTLALGNREWKMPAIPSKAGGIRGLLGQRLSDIAEFWLGAEADGGGGVTSAGGDRGTATGENSGLQFLGGGSERVGRKRRFLGQT